MSDASVTVVQRKSTVNLPGTAEKVIKIALRGPKGDTGDVTAEAVSAVGSSIAARLAAERARDRAELAATAAEALSYPIYASTAAGIAATTNGAAFVVQGTDDDFGLVIYRNTAGVAVQIGTLAGSGEVAVLTTRVDTVEPVTAYVEPYLDPSPDEVPVNLFSDGTYEDYYKRQSDGSYVRVNGETIRLDAVEATGTPEQGLRPGFGGHVMATDDGTVMQGFRSDGFWQFGPAPETDYAAYTTGSEGSREVWIAGDGVAPFKAMPELTGDNVGLVHHGHEGVSWLNIPSGELPARKTFSFLHGVQDGALASTVTTLTLLIGTGQSTSNGTASSPVVTATCPDTGYLLMFDVTPAGASQRGPRVLGNEQGPIRAQEYLDPTSLRLMIPAAEMTEGGSGETQWTQAAYEMRKRLGNTHAVAVATVGIGSQAYAQIKKGTVPYENLLEVVRHARAVAKMNGLDFNVVVGWPQHEGNVGDSQATYLAHITEFQGDLAADISALTDGEVADVLLVMNGYTNGTNYARTYTEQGLAQLQFALENPNKGLCVGPCFLYGRVTDKTHFTATGSARNGSYIGRAIGNHLLGRSALPLYTSSAVIVGSTIEGTMVPPYGAGTITGTSPYVDDPGNYGFTVIRTDTGVAVPITSVSIVGNKWVLTPTSPPAGVALEVSHGYRGTSGAGGGPTAAGNNRCPINDASADLDYFGNAMPQHLSMQKFTVTF